jgi:hypothetical protein
MDLHWEQLHWACKLLPEDCRSRTPIADREQFWRWETVAAFDITIEVALFAIAVYMAQSLRIRADRKLVVIFAFSLRLL